MLHDFLNHSSCSDAPMSSYFIVQVPMFPCSSVFVRMVHIPYPHVPTMVYDFLNRVHVPMFPCSNVFVHMVHIPYPHVPTMVYDFLRMVHVPMHSRLHTHGSCSHALMTSYSGSMFSCSNNFLCLVHVPML